MSGQDFDDMLKNGDPEAIAALIEGDTESAGPEAFASAPHPAWTGFPQGWGAGEDVAPADNERPADADSIDRGVLAECAREPQNDTGNGQRLLKHFGADLLHVRNVGWHAWAGTHWESEGGDEIATRLAQQTAARIVLEAEVISATPHEQQLIDAAAQAREAIAKMDKEESTQANRAKRQK